MGNYKFIYLTATATTATTATIASWHAKPTRGKKNVHACEKQRYRMIIRFLTLSIRLFIVVVPITLQLSDVCCCLVALCCVVAFDLIKNRSYLLHFVAGLMLTSTLC